MKWSVNRAMRTMLLAGFAAVAGPTLPAVALTATEANGLKECLDLKSSPESLTLHLLNLLKTDYTFRENDAERIARIEGRIAVHPEAASGLSMTRLLPRTVCSAPQKTKSI